MTPLIVRIHENHERKGISDPACPLCVEAQRRTQRPAWFRYLTAKDMTRAA